MLFIHLFNTITGHTCEASLMCALVKQVIQLVLFVRLARGQRSLYNSVRFGAKSLGISCRRPSPLRRHRSH